MQLASLKPLLTTLVLPPAGPLLLCLVGFLLCYFARKSSRTTKLGLALTASGLLLAWLLSCQAVAVILSQGLLKSYPVATVQSVQAQSAQAVVVLGSGLQISAPEYADTAQLSKWAAVRLRYGVWLASKSDLPLAFSGGRGWAADAKNTATEAQAASEYLKAFGLAPAKWLDDQSSDTADNASEMSRLLRPQSLTRIALVTHAWHMERSVKLFERAGFIVIPAPVNAIAAESYGLLNWLPSADGLQDSRNVLREWLALMVLKLRR